MTFTKLQEHVAEWIKDTAEDGYDGNTEAVLEDLACGGCASGMVGHLIYYTDTVKFYNEHQKEIDNLLQELVVDCGCSIEELFGDKWDKADPFARETMNQNLLAWFGFESVASMLDPEDLSCN